MLPVEHVEGRAGSTSIGSSFTSILMARFPTTRLRDSQKPSPSRVMAQAISQMTETVSLTCSESGGTTGVGTAAPRAASANCAW
jgi:hypothetical protein